MHAIRKKRIFSLLVTGLIFLSVLFPFRASAGSMPAFEAEEGVCLLDPDTGEYYATQNENQHYYPASTTKILTALTAMDVIADHLDERVTIGPEITMISADSSVAELTEGDSYTWRELLYGLLLPSGNDAAMTIAVNTVRMKSGNTEINESDAVTAFAELMNAKAKAVGTTDSHFVNPHGLMDEQHYTTPADMTKIALAAFSNNEIGTISKTTVYTCVSGNGKTHEWRNTNVLIQPTAEKFSDWTKAQLGISDNSNPFYSSYASSGKTGYVEEAGRCLVFSGSKGEMKLIGVIFKASDLQPVNSQAHQALETAVNDYTHVTLEEPYTKVTALFAGIFSGFRLTLSLNGHNTLTVPTSDKDQLTMSIEWDPKYCQDKGKYVRIQSDFEAGTQVATLCISGSTYQNRLPLYAENGMKVICVWDYVFGGAVILLIFAAVFCAVHFVKKSMRRRR